MLHLGIKVLPEFTCKWLHQEREVIFGKPVTLSRDRSTVLLRTTHSTGVHHFPYSCLECSFVDAGSL